MYKLSAYIWPPTRLRAASADMPCHVTMSCEPRTLTRRCADPASQAAIGTLTQHGASTSFGGGGGGGGGHVGAHNLLQPCCSASTGQPSSSQRNKQRKLDALVAELAAAVPPTAAGTGHDHRNRSQVLTDALAALRTLQQQVAFLQKQQQQQTQQQPVVSGASTAGGSYGTPLTASPRSSWPSQRLQNQTLPPAADEGFSSLPEGVTVQALPAVGMLLLRVTCRNRPGLMSNVADALSRLRLAIRTASLNTTPDGMAQQVYEVCGADQPTLGPEEVRFAVSAALHAHELQPDTTAAASPTAADFSSGNGCKRPRMEDFMLFD